MKLKSKVSLMTPNEVFSMVKKVAGV